LKRILLIVIVLIVYGSLYPWNFYARQLPANPLWMLLHSWPARQDLDPRDAAINVLLYMPLGMFAFLALDHRQRLLLRWIGPLLLGLVLSSCIEMVQLFDRTRNCSLVDVLCNVLGTAGGLVAGIVFRDRMTAVMSRPRRALLGPDAGALMLAFIWIAYEICTFFAIANGAASQVATFSRLDALNAFIAWLAFAKILESAVPAHRAGQAFLLVALIVPAKVLFERGKPSWSELAGVCLAWLVGRIPVGRFQSLGPLAVLFVVDLVLRGLAPFTWSSHPSHFFWMPFLGMLQAPWIFALPLLFAKSFLYGAALWLIHQTGRSLTFAIAIVAPTLAVIEAIQRYLPMHTAEITDPLLAVLLGVVLQLLEQ
jgi:VanZ family protein